MEMVDSDAVEFVQRNGEKVNERGGKLSYKSDKTMFFVKESWQLHRRRYRHPYNFLCT